jgi:hypothetical protein
LSLCKAEFYVVNNVGIQAMDDSICAIDPGWGLLAKGSFTVKEASNRLETFKFMQ